MGFSAFVSGDAAAAKPIIDQATANTPEAIQATADFAEVVGHHRVGTEQERNRYQGTPGELWTLVNNAGFPQGTYRWHPDRAWQLVAGSTPYARETLSADLLYAANVSKGLLKVVIPAAPPGLYSFAFTMAISSANPSKGEVRIQTPTTVIEGPIPADNAGPSGTRMNVSVTGLTSHRSGDLSLEFADFRTQGAAAHKGSLAVVHYVRPLAD